MRAKIDFHQWCLINQKETLLDEWDYSKNDKQPQDIGPMSHYNAWWKCSEGHIWQALAANRSKGHNCPYCSGRYAVKGVTDLATTHAYMLKEWNYSRNLDIVPEQVSAGSNKKVWWVCSKGHEWEASIGNRVKGRGCPVCSSSKRTSVPEKVILFYLSKIFDDIKENFQFEWSEHMEVDIYIPSIRLAVEYDGEYWHQSIDRDMRKDRLCQENRIDLIRIREPRCPEYNHDAQVTVFMTEEPASNMVYLDKTLHQLFKHIHVHYGFSSSFDINISKDYAQILDMIGYSEANASLEALFPDIAREWHDTKNGNLTPSMVSAGSSKLIWWRCAEGHEWKTAVSNRTNADNQNKCPYCQNKKAWPGYNDLCTLKPDLAAEWNYERNGDKRPEQFTISSGKTVWWKCEHGHEWKATVYSRLNSGCPVCGNKKVLEGYNDLASQYPAIALEWNHDKNGDLLPNNVTIGSNKNVWWKCRFGHEWKAIVNQRTSKNTGCPICLNQKVLKGFNDLTVTNPELLSEWNYEKNGDWQPSMVIAGSDRKVWWICEKGHEWEASLYSRAKSKLKVGCPYCANKAVWVGYNDLVTANPSLALEWNYEKNGDLRPENFTVSSGKRVWWKCSLGHEWEAIICNRNSKHNQTSCPVCRNQKIVKGYNDLETLFPEIALEWNELKNGDLLPSAISGGTSKKVWWKCSKGHEWEAAVHSRTKLGCGCPICFNQERRGRRRKK